MKPTKKTMKQLVEHYWPPPPKEEMQADVDEVWNRIQEELKKHDTSLRSLYGDGWSAEPLKQREFQVLSAMSLLAGRSTVPRITEIMKNWAGGIKEAHVYLTTSRLEERGLVTSQATDSAEGGGWPRCGFQATEDGYRALRRARAEGKQLENAREVERGLAERLRQFLKL